MTDKNDQGTGSAANASGAANGRAGQPGQEEGKEGPTVNDVGLADPAAGQAQNQQRRRDPGDGGIDDDAQDRDNSGLAEVRREQRAVEDAGQAAAEQPPPAKQEGEEDKDDEQDDDPQGQRNQSAEQAAQGAPNAKDAERAAPKAAKDKGSAAFLLDPERLVATQRSNLVTHTHRQALEQEFLKPITSGGGLFGTRKVDLRARKVQVCKDKRPAGGNIKQDLPESETLGGLLQVDGIYIDNSFNFKAKDINVQKLEERMLNAGQTEYFKANGEIKIDNDLLADELTRPADLAFEQSDAFQTIENNAIVTDRLNSFKKRYYRIDIIVGKMIIRKYAGLFTDEDQLMVELKHLCKLYDRRVSLALIPFYRARVEYLEKDMPDEDTKACIRTIQKDLKRECDELQKAAQQIYETWQKIVEMRAETQKTTTFYDLRVHQGAEGKDVLFNLVKKAPGELDAAVSATKAQAEATRVYCKLLIDGVEVAETRRMPINWPSYEVDISDQFQIHVFTLPAKVQLEIVVSRQRSKDQVVDRLDLVIPGGHVKSLTSASTLIKEYEFSRRQLYIEAQLGQGDDTLVRERAAAPQKEGNAAGAEAAKQAAAYRKDQEEFKQVNDKVKAMDLDGTILVRAEWEGFGEQMPPARSETLFQMNAQEKNRIIYSGQEQINLLQEQRAIDVNDPRYEDLLKNLQLMKNDYLERLLAQDAKFQLHDTVSFRQKLLRARASDPNFAQVPIPQLNSELINDEISGFYLDWLEDVHRQEAHKAVALRQRAGVEAAGAAARGTGDDPNSLRQINDEGEQEDPALLRRKAEILDKINKRRKISKQGTATNKQVHYQTVVDEVRVDPDMGLLELIMRLFRSGRKLKPLVRKRQAQAVDSISEAKLLVHIIRATDVPIRQADYDQIEDHHRQGENKKGQISTFGDYQRLFALKQVEPLVEVRLVDPEDPDHEQVLKTSVADGQCPEWNQILEFTLKAKNKANFTKQELEQSKMLVYFTLFDQEQQVEQITKARSQHYVENKYLGQFCVPLTTILAAQKLEGQVRVDRPLVLQNYRVVKDEIIFMPLIDGAESKEYKDQQMRDEEQIPTYLNVTMSLEPFIQIDTQNERENYPGAEKTPFLQAGSEWTKAIAERFKKSPRRVPVFLENLEGLSVFICRFLTPTAPPKEIYDRNRADSAKAHERAARYVSLIPYVDDSQLFQDMPDLTCLSQEFLDLGMGDSEEHAMLLCNMFNYIDRQSGAQVVAAEKDAGIHSYIVYGQAVPAGEGWYVARRDVDTNYVELWDPRTAECYVFAQSAENKQGPGADGGAAGAPGTGQRGHDPICPLKKIWAFVGRENVWANVQAVEAPVLLHFDLDDKKCWSPFLDPNNNQRRTAFYSGKPLGEKDPDPRTVQISAKIPELKYAPPAGPEQVRRLERSLQKYLAGRFEEERIAEVRKTTNWNKLVGEQVKRVLGADPEVSKEVEGLIGQRGNRGGAGAQGIGAEARGMLLDFEEYMLQARRGGTNSTMKPRGRQPDGKPAARDEDIRATQVQATLAALAAQSRKQCWAVPLNTTFSSQEHIWEMVKNTRAHEIDHQEVEFSLSVMLKPYSSNVFSVWIYLAVLRDLPRAQDDQQNRGYR